MRAQLHLDEALNVTSHRRGNVKDIAKGFKGESRQVANSHSVVYVTWHAIYDARCYCWYFCFCRL